MLTDILNNLSNVLMFFVPGYIFLLKRKSISSYKKDDDINLIIKSVGISAIIKLISGLLFSLTWIKFLISSFVSESFIEKYYDELIILFYTFIAYMLFYLITYIEYNFNTYCKEKLIKLFKGKNNFLHFLFNEILYREKASTVWNHILDNSDNKQIRVYIKNSNIVYMGFIKQYTLDPEEDIKEICLNKFTVVEEIENWENGEDIFKEKDCFFEDDDSYVYIMSDNIQRIEIINPN